MTLRELFFRLLRHWILMCAVAGAILVTVVVWTLLTTPRFQSTAVLRIMDQSQQLGVMDQLADLPGASLMGFGRDDLETEIGVLRSWRITEAVVDSLALMVQVEKPAGLRRTVLDVVAQGDPDRQGTLTLRSQGASGYTVRVKEPHEPAVDLPPVQPGGEVEFAGYRLRLAPGLAEDPPGKIRIEILPRYEAVKTLREDLDIRPQEGGSRLVGISYTVPDREVAAAVVNGLLNEYVTYKTGAESFEGRATAQDLGEEVENFALQLAEAEERLRRYQETHQLVAPEEQATQQVRRVAQLQLQDDALRVEREALSRLLDLVSERAGATDPAAYRQLATFPTLISNRGIQDLLLVLLGLENERSALRNRRTEENRDVRQLTERIRELETQLHRLGIGYLESLDGQLTATGEALDRLNLELEALPELEMGYLRLLRDRTVLSEAYLLVERQLRMTEVQNSIRSEGVRIVDVGLVAHEEDHEYPKPLVNLFLGLVLAMAAGLGAGLVRDLWDG